MLWHDVDDDVDIDDDDDDDDGYGGDDSKYQRQTLGNNYLTVINSTPSIIGWDDDTRCCVGFFLQKFLDIFINSSPSIIGEHHDTRWYLDFEKKF